MHRESQRALKGEETAFPRAAFLGQVEQSLFGRFQLRLGVQFGFRTKGAVHHHFAQIHQLATQPGIINHLAIFAGIDDTHHGREKLRQIGRAADLIHQAGMFKLGAERHRIGKLARFHAALDGVENPPMHRIGEVFRRQIFADTFKCLVIGQKRAKQRLFGGQIGWRNTLRQAEQTGPRGGAGRGFKIIHVPL